MIYAINFFPYRIKKNQHNKRIFILQLIMSLILSIVIIFIWNWTIQVKINTQNNAYLILQKTQNNQTNLTEHIDINTIESDITDAQKLHTSLTEKLDKIKALHKKAKEEYITLQKLINAIPKDVYLLSIINNNTEIILEGRTNDNKNITNLIESLTENFKSVALVNMQWVNNKSLNEVAFKITIAT